MLWVEVRETTSEAEAPGTRNIEKLSLPRDPKNQETTGTGCQSLLRSGLYAHAEAAMQEHSQQQAVGAQGEVRVWTPRVSLLVCVFLAALLVGPPTGPFW